MLLHQGARAFALWTGTTPPIQAMQRALDGALDGT
jgi:shikimate 5-dehydrogenase